MLLQHPGNPPIVAVLLQHFFLQSYLVFLCLYSTLVPFVSVPLACSGDADVGPAGLITCGRVGMEKKVMGYFILPQNFPWLMTYTRQIFQHVPYALHSAPEGPREGRRRSGQEGRRKDKDEKYEEKKPKTRKTKEG